MPNPSGPDRNAAEPAQDRGAADEHATDAYPVVPEDPETTTEVLVTESAQEPRIGQPIPPELRFTAPGFDAGKTEIIQAVPDQATEVFRSPTAGPGKARPQLIPPRLAAKLPGSASHAWGWVLALVLIILLLAVIAVLGTLWLTRDSRAKASQEERVRESISHFDIAVQNGDLPMLRSLTCGLDRDNYVNYNEQAWADTYRRIAAAKQYPVVASIDQVVVNGDHAEANVTAFMASAPEVRSTRSLDLQYRDNQWKICQSRTE